MSVAETIPPETLGMRLERARKFAKLEQSDLAEKLNLTSASISNYELDRRQPRNQMALVKKWAEICGVSYVWLLTGVTDRTTYEAPSDTHRARLRSVGSTSRSARS